MVERKKKGAVEVRKPVPEALEAIEVVPGVTIVITQAFCPNGHNLVRQNTDALFDGYPGICLYLEAAGWEGEVTLSPIHGDHSKVGMPASIPEGTRCIVRCPVCEAELPRITDCGCAHGGDLVGIYLRPSLAPGDVVGVCNILGCYRSRVMDQFELLSEFVVSESEE